VPVRADSCGAISRARRRQQPVVHQSPTACAPTATAKLRAWRPTRRRPGDAPQPCLTVTTQRLTSLKDGQHPVRTRPRARAGRRLRLPDSLLASPARTDSTRSSSVGEAGGELCPGQARVDTQPRLWSARTTADRSAGQLVCIQSSSSMVRSAGTGKRDSERRWRRPRRRRPWTRSRLTTRVHSSPTRGRRQDEHCAARIRDDGDVPSLPPVEDGRDVQNHLSAHAPQVDTSSMRPRCRGGCSR